MRYAVHLKLATDRFKRDDASVSCIMQHLFSFLPFQSLGLYSIQMNCEQFFFCIIIVTSATNSACYPVFLLLQIFLCMVCPPLIPLLITFDDSAAEMTMNNKIAPNDRRRTAKKDTDSVKSTVKRCTLRKFSNFFNFYNAAIVKFCFHSVIILYGCLQIRFLTLFTLLQFVLRKLVSA